MLALKHIWNHSKTHSRDLRELASIASTRAVVGGSWGAIAKMRWHEMRTRVPRYGRLARWAGVGGGEVGARGAGNAGRVDAGGVGGR